MLDSNFQGPLGYGWTHTYRMGIVAPKASTLRGTQLVPVDSVVEVFDVDGSGSYSRPNGHGTYQSLKGDFRALTKAGDGTYQLRGRGKYGTRFLFDRFGKLTKVIDPNGNRQILKYDATDRLSTISDDSGQTTRFAYDSSDRITSIGDPAGRQISVATGSTQQFTATGTYSDGSTQNITGKVSWASSNSAVAIINGAGLASAVAAGSTSISATLSGVTGCTGLTVQTAPLAITTTSLPSGTQGQPYNATLTATGESPPYRWSRSSGTLPNGLSLSAGGVISGTPTVTGSFSFTVTVTDAAARSTSAPLSITVLSSAAGLTIWPVTAVPGRVDHGADSAVELGVKFRSDVTGSITGIRFYKASTNTGTHVGNLWTSDGQLLASATFTNEAASGWQEVNFATPVTIAANTVYVASYHTNVGHYSQDLNYFASAGYDNSPLHALAKGVSGGSTPTARPAASRAEPTTPPTTGWTWCSGVVRRVLGRFEKGKGHALIWQNLPGDLSIRLSQILGKSATLTSSGSRQQDAQGFSANRATRLPRNRDRAQPAWSRHASGPARGYTATEGWISPPVEPGPRRGVERRDATRRTSTRAWVRCG